VVIWNILFYFASGKRCNDKTEAAAKGHRRPRGPRQYMTRYLQILGYLDTGTTAHSMRMWMRLWILAIYGNNERMRTQTWVHLLLASRNFKDLIGRKKFKKRFAAPFESSWWSLTWKNRTFSRDKDWLAFEMFHFWQLIWIIIKCLGEP